ncbi:site-specific DNA-methyltransferase [Methanobacterium formicicum]|uniref:Adenine specific DNA methylase Mod n=1 Tax=Methanobacterium formicicum TaxID=2162 RepID=A0A090I9W6_METFO|nr:site-specific DNA-methyltransferase [Methanobacterium formicicum]MDH2658957.1 site-specific DNA-methyltransferase [Methanobacterium formicicum]CEA14167.1 adenine specific DNA methylase Mod [Methanobacterium formicicum]
MQETQLNGESLDIVSENVSELKELFPEIVTEDKIDFDKLREVLGKYTEDDYERYNFTWKGKSAALRLAQTPSTGTLRPCKEESKNWDTTENLYIEGDNLEVLKLLQKSYYGKIKMIYIDPPYNTGNDFVYPDNYHDNMQNYLEITGQVDNDLKKISNNSDISGRYHTNWLNMIYPRLRLSRNLLSDDGVIFISIGDNEIDNLKKISSEIFGEENFVAVFSRVMKKGSSMGKFVSPSIDYILCYTKNVSLNKGFVFPQNENYIKQFKNQDEIGKYKTSGLFQGSLDPLRGCKNQRYYVKCPDGSLAIPPGNIFPKIKKDGEKVVPKTRDDKVWRWSADSYLIEKKNLVFKKSKNSPLINENGEKSQWNIFTKQYYKSQEESKVVPGTIIEDAMNSKASQELKSLKIPFDFAKPTQLIKYLSIISRVKKNEIVIDFFSGSATTADSLMQLNVQDGGNRKFIMVQLPEKIDKNDDTYKEGYENICEIGKERIRRAGDKIVSEMNQNGQTSLDSKTNNNLDIGFKVFKLDSSNLSKWDPEYDNLEQTLLDSVKNLVPGRNELDLVYEIMLKYGIDLTLPIEEYQIKDKKFYSIGFGALIVCLDDNLTSTLASEIIKLKDDLSPEVMRVVFKDNGFASDSDKTNIKETLKTNGIEEFVTI